MKTKMVLVMSLLTFIAGCSTVAGTVCGLGEDVKSGTDTISGWIKPAIVNNYEKLYFRNYLWYRCRYSRL
jgi:predicted small secreted protein